MSKTISNFARILTLTVATLLGTTSIAAAAEPASESSSQQSSKTLEGQININTASAAELELLPGIGPAIAARIVDYHPSAPAVRGLLDNTVPVSQ